MPRGNANIGPKSIWFKHISILCIQTKAYEVPIQHGHKSLELTKGGACLVTVMQCFGRDGGIGFGVSQDGG
jgi:hypothetical protein